MSERYNRQELIPEWEQDKLSDAKVIILGVGATGSYVATNLALSGVGHLVLVDYDTVDISNLNRQLLYLPKDIGKNKAEVAKYRLERLNPDITITDFPDKMQQLPQSLLDGTTVIACCLDTFRGRRWANSLALREGWPMVNGGMYAFLGDVQTILPYDTACFECQPLVSQEKLAQACSPLGDERKDVVDKEEAPLPSVATLSSIISGIMSQEILKIIMNIGKLLDNYVFYDALNNAFTELRLERNDRCPICGTGTKLESREALVFENEQVGTFRKRIALAFGLADPRLMYKGKFLVDNGTVDWKTGDKIYVTDERLAKPIVVQLNISK